MSTWPDRPARASWRSIWPSDQHPVSWDAVAEIVSPRDTEWVLIEANAHLEELGSNCESKNWRDGLSLIADGLARTQNALGVPMEADWLKGHYRYASRLTALTYLLSQGLKSRLVVICFCGDQGDFRRRCPGNQREWEAALAARDRQPFSLVLGIMEMNPAIQPAGSSAPIPAASGRP